MNNIFHSQCVLALRHHCPYLAPLLLSLAPSLVQAQTAGSLDPALVPNVLGSFISTSAVQADGKILLGGKFSSVNGQAHNHIDRLNADGTADMSFNPGTGANGQVQCVAVQADGKILLGGYFTTVDGQTRIRIARLLPDGRVENTATFNPGTGANDVVQSVAMQADGKILLGGAFTTVDGQTRNRIARLNADGTLESTATFNPGTGANTNVYIVAVQADGKILLGGGFGSVNGQARKGIARLNADGTLESAATFNPGTGANSNVYSVAVQADGKILLGGQFITINGQARNRIARLNADGTLESTATFNPGTGANNYVHSVAVQADGKVLLGGYFTTVDGQTRNHIARLNADGTLESTATFNPGTGPDGNAWSVTLQADGKILLGGDFTAVDGQARKDIARLTNDGAGQSLTVPGNSRVHWARGGAGPEVGMVTFELSTNGGVTWNPLGSATRIAGGWELTGLNLPANAAIRARGRTRDGLYNGSSGMVEQTLNVPEIAVLGPPGIDLVDGFASTDFGPVALGNSSSKLFTIRNTGSANLTGLALTLAATGNPAEFLLGLPAATTLAPGATTTFSVTFSPTAFGVSTATLQIASNDGDENPFEINLAGSRPPPEIVVEQPAGIGLTDGSAAPVDFGAVATGASVSRTFAIRNTGTGNLYDIAVTLDGGSAPGDYSVWELGSTELAPGAATTFKVVFSPAGPGARTTTLLIASNDEDENPFEINLTGRRATPQLDAWRQTYFGSTPNSGAGADLSDPDRDGVVNLMEFAAGSGPWTVNGQPGQIVKNGSSLEFTWLRRKAALAEIAYEVEWSESLPGPWSATAVSTSVLTDGSVMQEMRSALPAGSAGKRFVRLRVTRL